MKKNNIENKMVSLELNISEVQLIISALVNQRYSDVYELINKIQEQTIKEMNTEKIKAD